MYERNRYMKSRFATIIAVISCFINIEARATDRFAQFSRPTTQTLTRVSFIDTVLGWVGGENGEILKTTDGGRNWLLQRSSGNSTISDLFMLNARLGWAVSLIYYVDTVAYFGSEILRTTNGGTTWIGSRFEENDRYYNTVMFQDSLVGFIAGERGDIQRSTDGGLSWRRMQVDTSIASGFSIKNIQFASPLLGFAMGGQFDITGIIWRTTDGGLRWRAESVAPEPIYEMHFVDALHIIGICGDFDYGASMVRSKDAGNRWEYTYLDIFGQPGSLSFRTSSEAWVPVGNRIMRTVDTAKTWLIIDSLGERRIFDLKFVNANIGYAVADSGYFYKYDIRSLAVDDDVKFQPHGFALLPNYPNPFNPSTTISFSLPKPLDTRLVIVDLLGREVRRLLLGQREEGIQLVAWDGRDDNGTSVGSGVYFCRLQAGSFTASRKLMLVK
jgi:photosystem II stability/assembly factor-like uncharacterized protein